LDVIGFFFCGFGATHTCEDSCDLNLFDLGCPQSTESGIEFLACATEGLPTNLGFC